MYKLVGLVVLCTGLILPHTTAAAAAIHPSPTVSYRITAYFPTGYQTATGTNAVYGEVAVDPNYIPLDAYIHISGLGIFHAEDIGGAVKGQHIDILVYTWKQAYAVQGSGYRDASWWCAKPAHVEWVRGVRYCAAG